METPTPTYTRGEYDRWLFYATFLLVALGLLMIFSATSQSSRGVFFLKRQMVFATLGTGLMVWLSRFPYRNFYKLAGPLFIVSLLGVLGTLMPILGHEINGASRWINLGFITIQPTEFLKPALVVYLAYSLCKKEDRVREFSIGILPHVILMMVISVMIMLQPDLGTVMILWIITCVMLVAGGIRPKHMILPLVIIVAGFIFLANSQSYRANRIKSYMDPWGQESDSGYQVTRSLMAYGTGGVLGKGLSNSELKVKHLPESHTDFIFPILGEEWGLVGVLGALGLYMFLLARGFWAAFQTSDPFGCLLAIGLSSSIGLQIVINVGVTMGLLPPTGLTLPLMSYGGSSLICTMASIGVILNIGQEARRAE